MKRRIYDHDFYQYYEKQPYLFELQLGKGLMHLAKKSEEEGDSGKEAELLKEIDSLKNQFDDEYGLPVSKIHICNKTNIGNTEYVILHNGVEVGRSLIRSDCFLCIDTGKVKNPEDLATYEKVKEPVFGIDAYVIPDEQIQKFKASGYACVPPVGQIRVHLYSVIRKFRTKILDFYLVNNLIDKVCKSNPDVITAVFFNNRFHISDMKAVLNRLLAEEVSIRDMNTILEIVAESFDESKSILSLAEKVRERLALTIIRKHADEKKGS